MKTKNLIIGVLTIAVVILSILLFRAQKCKDNPSGNTSSACDFNSSDSCCVHITSRLEDIYVGEEECGDSTECGKEFGEDSLDYIRTLIKDAKQLNKFNQIYGYQIEVKHINAMCKAINEFDSVGYKDKDGKVLTVAGIRFYKAVSERFIKGRKRRKTDLVMIPYLSSGHDAYTVDDPSIRGILNMYAHFRPCPKLCGEKECYIYE